MPNPRGSIKRRIMRAFKLEEISAVDRPAQEGARMTIMKSREDDDVDAQDIFSRTLEARKYNSPDRAAMNAAYGGAGEHAKQRWLACVEKVRSRDGCSGVEALQLAKNTRVSLPISRLWLNTRRHTETSYQRINR
jgi:hypothetical protein